MIEIVLKLFIPIAKLMRKRNKDFENHFIYLLHLTLHYFDQRYKQEVHCDVFYLQKSSLMHSDD